MIYKEFDLPDNHPFIACLDKMLEWAKTSDVPDKVVGDRDEDPSVKEEHLRNKANCNCLFSRFDDHKGFDFSEIKKYSIEIYKEQTGEKDFIVIPVAKTWYPSGGWLGWHIDQEGGRIYSAYAEGKSFFRYEHPETKKVITSWDKPGWNFRVFTFDKANPMRHCIHAEDLRVSIGYRFVNG